MNDAELIRRARARLDTDDGKRDWGLAVYMVRDLQTTREAELRDLAWVMDQHGSYGEAVWLLDMLMERVT